MVKKYKYLIFDGDDTLWETQPLYKSTIDEFYSILDTKGFLPEEYKPIFNSINQDLLTKIKFSKDRLGLAMSMTFDSLCQQTNVRNDPKINEQLKAIAQNIYINLPKIIEGVGDALEELSKDHKLIFYSGGSRDTQTVRLKKHKLESFFCNRCYIVPKKDESSFQAILKEMSISPDDVCMIGNSPRFDINPALRTGADAIWFYTSFWKDELEDILTPVFTTFSINEITNILLTGSGWSSENIPISKEAGKFRDKLNHLIHEEQIWVIGPSPKYDINPALSAGCKVIWLPMFFDSIDIEPFYNKILVGLNYNHASIILKDLSNDYFPIVRRHHRNGDLGGRLIVD